ncbi:FAD dependent oxidoreductase [Dactylonectria macrodidyma]|uniref:FAD dependent oxidoreductase n=1 Tax=Dactylonectria macrodidyma TaxID=307937 RepID=A0A9P9EPE9_9HYPO|nr:FAD dependent oxidoreductase [Dactylonectria macrodidyma]
MTSLPIRRVAVIGAGVSGVLTAAHLKSEGLDMTVFERAPVTGGVWVWDSKLPLEPTYPSAKPSVASSTFHDPPDRNDKYILHSGPGPAYDGLKNNVPTELLEVSLNAWKPNTESFADHHVLADYIQDTALKTGVNDLTHFNTQVQYVKKDGGQWKVKTATWDHVQQETTSQDWTFDAIVVASGHYHDPKTPDIPGLSEWKRAFPSRIQHSKGYRNNKGFENQFQTILLIGGSASSLDIAKEVAPIAKKVWQSTRGGTFDIPPSLLPENSTRVAQVSSFNSLQSDQSDGSGAIPGTVTLVDGQVLENVDRVIVATGYQFTLPFLPEYHQDDLKPEDADDRVLVSDGLQLHNLHQDIFYIPDPTLVFVGVPFYTATFSLFEFQAIAVAAFFSGRAKLPSEPEMRSEYKQRVEEKGYGKKFHSLWGADVEYAAALMEWVNQGRAPEEKKPSGYSREWIETKEKMRMVPNPKNSLYQEA